jgi:hypothetical protein
MTFLRALLILLSFIHLSSGSDLLWGILTGYQYDSSKAVSEELRAYLWRLNSTALWVNVMGSARVSATKEVQKTQPPLPLTADPFMRTCHEDT